MNCLILIIQNNPKTFDINPCVFSVFNTTLFRRALTPPGMARDDWKIIRALSEVACLFFSYQIHQLQYPVLLC